MYVLSLGHFSPCCIIHFSREDVHILMGQVGKNRGVTSQVFW